MLDYDQLHEQTKEQLDVVWMYMFHAIVVIFMALFLNALFTRSMEEISEKEQLIILCPM